MVVIVSRREERGRIPKSHLQLEPQNAAVERERPVDIRDFQMNVAYSSPGIDGRKISDYGRTHTNWMIHH